MSNSALVLSSLDFDTLKNEFKTFLKTQSVFRDYDFDASNINVLLDVMSYNTFKNGFYLNMVASEMFLDSAQKYDSVVSHAKELNYVPRSTRSSQAEVSFNIQTTGISGRFTLPKGTRFTGTNSNGSFTFTTDELNTYISSNGVYSVANLSIYDGTYFKDSYIVDYNIESQQFPLTNQNVDINSVTVSVVENNGANTTTFTKAQTLFGLDSTSEVYFLQASHNNLYEVVFGDGLFGRKPVDGAIVTINYRIANGTDADGISEFTLEDDLGPINGGSATVESITVVENSSSGANQESIESIRFAAPRYFATQQRAIASDDYSALVLNNFGGEISDVAVYGGETVEPKLYGRVIVSLKPASGTVAPTYIKNRISNYLIDYIALPNRILISDPDYLYCSIVTNVQYDKTSTDKTISEIRAIVLDSVLEYSASNLEKFSNDFRYSRLIAAIDDADPSITSNDTDVRIIKRISPLINYATSYTIDVNNQIYYDATQFSTYSAHKQLHDSEFDLHVAHASLISSRFTFNAENGTIYDLCFFEDDGLGNIVVYKESNSEMIPIQIVGSIDYTAGTFQLNNISVSNYGTHISLYIRPRDKDILANQNKIILIDSNDVNVTVTETQR